MINIFNKSKNIIISTLILFFIICVMTNYLHNNYDGYEEIKLEQVTNEKPFFQLKFNDLQTGITEDLLHEENVKLVYDRKCEITGNMHDRHKVRWVRMLLHYKLLQYVSNFGKTAPYYFEIILHSIFIFLSLMLIKKYFLVEEKYIFFYLLYITFIFQQYLGEYTYSIFDLFFTTAALCASKKRNIIIFSIICALATLNRETGFLLIFSWLIFNNNMKQIIPITIVTSVPFVLLNYDIISCLVQPKFFAPMEYQHGQVNFSDLAQTNIFSAVKSILLNYVIPFGIGIYFFLISKIKNKYLISIFILYLLVFLVASPVHKMELKFLLLPYIWIFIYFYEKKTSY